MYSMMNQPKKEAVLRAAGVIFGVIALAHALRIVFQWNVVVEGWVVPVWVSVIPVILGGWVAWAAMKAK